MSNFLNPGNESFKSDINSRIYVDKTGLLKELNKVIGTSERCVSLSHARRFGKSQAAGMIDAYYSMGCDSKEIFASFEISRDSDFEKHLNKYYVIHIDVSSVADYHSDDLVEYIVRLITEDLKKSYETINTDKSINMLLKEVYDLTKTPFVIVIDEWDHIIRNKPDRQDLVHEYLQFLHSLFKSEESKSFLALGYITGILPIKKVRDESALNNFREFTMLNSKQLTPFFGFTEEEVKELCEEYNMNFDTIKTWYDGYVINGMHMYNPNSVYQAMVDGAVESYWKNTSSFETINDFIAMNFDGLKEDVIYMLSGRHIEVNVNSFGNDLSMIASKDEAITALIHLGYLGYDCKEKEAFIPNFEVAEAYQSVLKNSSWDKVAESIGRCESLLKSTIAGESDVVAQLIELAHETYTSILQYNDENSLECVITMAYFTAPEYYNIIRELPSGKGFADFAFIPRKDSGNKPAMIIELKYDKDADTAIRQIKEKRYTGALQGYGEEIILVGVNYDTKTKKHECVIERVYG